MFSTNFFRIISLNSRQAFNSSRNMPNTSFVVPIIPRPRKISETLDRTSLPLQNIHRRRVISTVARIDAFRGYLVLGCN